MASNERDVLEDPQAEGEERDEVEVDPQPVAHERQRHGNQGVRDEAGDEDPVVVVIVQLGADRSQNRIQACEDGDRRLACQVGAHVDVEHQTKRDPERKANQRKPHLGRSRTEGLGA